MVKDRIGASWAIAALTVAAVLWFTGAAYGSPIDLASGQARTVPGGRMSSRQVRASLTISAPSGAAVQATPNGAATYAEHCAACHGPEGSGGIGPSLRESPLSLDEMASVVEEGMNAMPPFAGTLDAGRIEATVRYVASLSSGPTTTTLVRGDPEPTASGAALYGERCAYCHGPEGEGGGSVLAPALQTSEKTIEEIIAVVTRGRSLMPVFGQDLDPTQIEEVAAVAKALQSGSAIPPTLSPTADGAAIFAFECAACHGLGGKGGFGPELAGTTLSVEQIAAMVTRGTTMGPLFRDRLSQDQIGSVATYVTGLATIPETVEEPGGPAGLTEAIVYLSIVALAVVKLAIDYRRMVVHKRAA